MMSYGLLAAGKPRKKSSGNEQVSMAFWHLLAVACVCGAQDVVTRKGVSKTTDHFGVAHGGRLKPSHL